MLTLSRKSKEQIYIEDEPLTILSVSNSFVTFTFKNTTHVVEKGKMFELEPNTIICYTRKVGSYAKIQLKSTHKVLRGEIYAMAWSGNRRNNPIPNPKV
jgi:hypothetical protein